MIFNRNGILRYEFRSSIHTQVFNQRAFIANGSITKLAFSNSLNYHQLESCGISNHRIRRSVRLGDQNVIKRFSHTTKRKLSIDSKRIKEDIWALLKEQAYEMLGREPLLQNFLVENILRHSSFSNALISRLASKLSGFIVPYNTWESVLREALQESMHLQGMGHDMDIEQLAMEDLIAIDERDPACKCVAQAFLYFKGYKALQAQRFAHVLWLQKRYDLAHLIQARVSEVFDIDIHPGASIGGGLMLDHGTGVVIGETARIGKNCSILHGVTLGGTGNEKGDRHPKLGDNILIGCGATILGNIQIGNNCRIGSGSMILKPLPAGATAVGNPCRVLNIDDTLSTDSFEAVAKDIRNKVKLSPSSSGTEDKSAVKVWSHVWIPKEVSKS